MNSTPSRSLLIAAFVLLALAAWAAVSISHISAASARRQQVVTSRQALDVARAELEKAISKSQAKPPRKRIAGAERAFGTYLTAIDAVRAEIRARMKQIFAALYPSGELNTATVPSIELLKSDPEKGKLVEEMEELDAQLQALGKEVEEFQLLVGKSDFTIASPDTTITTFPRNSSIEPFGFPDTATYGQIITVPTNGDSVLTSFTFEMCQPNTINFRGYVFAWDGTKATGSALFISSLMNTGSTDCQQVTFNTEGIPLTAGQQYVLFASISQDCSGSGQGQWGARNDNPYSGGSFVYLNNGCNPAAWTSSAWSSFTIFDLAFSANFAAPCTLTCPENITVSNDAGQCGAVVNYPAPTPAGDCGAVICSPATGAFFPVGTTTVNCFINDCDTAFAVDTANNLISFALSAPGTILSSVPITGLLAGDQIHGIDFRPATGQLYGLGVNLMTETAHLYTINATTGAATQVGGDIAVTGGVFASYGFDFNPTVDRIRVTSNEDLNLRLDPDTGAVSLDTNINPPGVTVTGLAYTNNFAGATQTTLYGLNIASPGDSLGIVGGVNGVPSPNGGTFTTVGLLGVDAITFTGFDISRCDGTAYASLGVSDNYALYTIDLGTGAATLVGTIGKGGQVNAMALTPSSASCSFTITVIDTQPPTITCPDNVTAVAAQTCPISSSATVTFPAPTVSDNCPGVTSVCNPPSGSTFPVGTTTVTCTATDASGNTATCSFTVTVFSGCLQDDSNPAKVVLFNAATGEYRFCCNGTVFTGVGTVIVKGCIVTIQHYPADRRVLIKFDGAVRVGTASLQSPPGAIKCTIIDRNTRNNTCACQVSVGQSM